MSKLYHFWLSDSLEANQLMSFCAMLEIGLSTSFGAPNVCRCEIELAGEKIAQRYSVCSKDPEAYGPNSTVHIKDAIYLGQGHIIEARPMRRSEIIERMNELDLIVPSCLIKRQS